VNIRGGKRKLRRDLVTPIAAGENIFGPRAVSYLVNGIDILRVDATTIGGLTGAVVAINIAAAAGRNVFPHVFSPIHVHLAFALPDVESVELIPEESGVQTRCISCSGMFQPSRTVK
jgi:L-alanine-DL-glutamate epimerase-like enolase superfamily enzyme